MQHSITFRMGATEWGVTVANDNGEPIHFDFSKMTREGRAEVRQTVREAFTQVLRQRDPKTLSRKQRRAIA